MTSTLRHIARASLACLALVMFAPPAQVHAQSPARQAVTILLDSWVASGLETPRYETLTESGGTVTLGGLSANYPPERGGGQVLVGQLVISGIALDAEGGFTAALMQMENLRVAHKDINLKAARGEARDLTYPSAAKMRELMQGGGSFTPLYRSVEINDLVVTAKDGREIPIRRLAVTTDNMVDGLPTSSTFAAEGIAIAADTIDDAEAAERMRAMGYERLDVTIRGAARWDLDAGNLDIENIELGAENAGALIISLNIGGFTREFIEAMREQQKGGVASDEMQQAMLQHLQSITLRGLSISFHNASIVERAVEVQAREQGVTAEQVKAQHLAMLPAMLESLQNPAFAAKVETALRRFIENPTRLTLRAEPQAPLPAAQIFGMAMMMPAAIVTMLNVHITAD